MSKKTIDERARFPVTYFGKSMAGQHVEACLSLDAIAWLTERDSDMSDVQLTTGELNKHGRVVEYMDAIEPFPWWVQYL